MAFVVTANYRDRSSEFPWLVRHENESSASARAYKALSCESNKGFQEPDDLEKEGGCGQTALVTGVKAFGPEVEPKGYESEQVCESIEELETEADTRLHFDTATNRFYHEAEVTVLEPVTKVQKVVVHKVKRLVLKTDKTMYASV